MDIATKYCAGNKVFCGRIQKTGVERLAPTTDVLCVYLRNYFVDFELIVGAFKEIQEDSRAHPY